MATKKKTLVLLDSHAVLHRAFHAMPGFTSPKGEPTGALYGFLATLFKTVDDFKPDYLAACFDLPEPTFRHDVYEKYKAKRPEVASELSSQIEKSKVALKLFGVPFYDKVGFEADDILATICEQTKDEKDLNIIIVTGDLDTLQLVRPGVRVYTMKRGIKESVFYDTKAVNDRYGFAPKLVPDFKGLMGDPSDNIIGVAGIGEKTAKTLIQNFGSLEDLYKKLKKDRGLLEKAGIKERIINLLEENEEEAMFSKVLATTRTDAPVKFSLKDAKWNPDFNRNDIEEFLKEHGFRSLINKLAVREEKPLPSPTVSEKEKKEIKLGFWLLDSRRTNPALQDVFVEIKLASVEKVKEVILEGLKKDGLFNLYSEVELPLIKIISDMEKEGVLLDAKYLDKLSKEYHKKLEKIKNKIWEMAGGEFNISSPKQLSEVLFERLEISPKGMRKTGTGAISTRFSELEKIQDRHPIIKEIFAYRELAKLTSTYIDNLPKMVDKESRLHTTFNQEGTATGRLSSSEPNLQNIPIKSDAGRAIRKAFVSPKGWTLGAFDYSQIELRILAFLANDKKLKEAFLNGEDIHAKVASEVFNVAFDKVTSNMRRQAKVINFGIAYGMGITSLKKNLGCSRGEAQAFYDEYFSDFPGIANYMEDTKESTRKIGYTKTVLGRRRYLPEINTPVVFIRKEAERMAINAPIQGTAADIIKKAMVMVDEVLEKEGLKDKVKMILQVHDELIFEIKDEVLEKAAEIIKKAMEGPDLLGNVPLLVDGKVGKNWGTMEKIKVSN